MAYDYPGSCAPSRWLPSAPKQKLERGPFGLAHRVPRASPMRAASGCLPPAVRIIPQYVPGLQPRFGACCQTRAIYYQQKRGFPPTRKDTNAACCGLPLTAGWNGSWSRVPVQGDIWDIWDVWDGMAGHKTLERFVSVRVRRKPGSCPTMRRRPKGSAWASRLARRSLKRERGAHGEYRRKTIRRIVGFSGRA